MQYFDNTKCRLSVAGLLQAIFQNYLEYSKAHAENEQLQVISDCIIGSHKMKGTNSGMYGP